MNKVKKHKISLLVLCFLGFVGTSNLALAGKAQVADKTSSKIAVQMAMKNYVTNNSSKEGYLPVLFNGKILQLKLKTSKKYPDGFHAGVKTDNNLATSCADFTDKAGHFYDIDFLAHKVQSEYKIIQPIVHKVCDTKGLCKKNPYDLNH